MAKDVFSVPIFFIVFRETIEGAIILGTLLGLVYHIAYNTRRSSTPSDDSSHDKESRILARKLKILIAIGGIIGFIIALAIGAAFIAIWFTKTDDLFSEIDDLWSAILELIASVMIFITGLLMLSLRRVKQPSKINAASGDKNLGRLTAACKWVLFCLPFITVLREGLEVVVYIGGVSLGQPATSIPIPAIVGIIAGLAVGIIVYQIARRSTPTIFMAIMTNLLLLVGAGLFSRSVGLFEWYRWLKSLEYDLPDGNGPGTYQVQGNVWHLDCCNPYDLTGSGGWAIFNATLGWTNNATLGSILSYVSYWLAVMVALACMKFKDKRAFLPEKQSAAGAY